LPIQTSNIWKGFAVFYLIIFETVFQGEALVLLVGGTAEV